MAGVRWNGALGGFQGFAAEALLESCRRLVQSSCRGREGYAPLTARSEILDLRQAGPEDVLVVAVGYNDWHDRFPSDFDAVVSAARVRGFHHIAWVTYRSQVGYTLPGTGGSRSNYGEMNRILVEKIASGAFPDVRLWDLDRYTLPTPAGWFASDGVHETRLGSWGVADWISRHVRAFDDRPCVHPWTPGVAVAEPVPRPRSAAGDRRGPRHRVAVRGMKSAMQLGWTDRTMVRRQPREPVRRVRPPDRGARLLTIVALLGAGTPAGGTVAAAATAPSRYVAIAPCRVLDTRDGSAVVAAGGTIGVAVAGDRCDVPSNATAAALVITAVAPLGLGYVTAWPAGTPRPGTSVLNYRAGEFIPASQLVRLGSRGRGVAVHARPVAPRGRRHRLLRAGAGCGHRRALRASRTSPAGRHPHHDAAGRRCCRARGRRRAGRRHRRQRQHHDHRLDRPGLLHRVRRRRRTAHRLGAQHRSRRADACVVGDRAAGAGRVRRVHLGRRPRDRRRHRLHDGLRSVAVHRGPFRRHRPGASGRHAGSPRRCRWASSLGRGASRLRGRGRHRGRRSRRSP